MKENNYPKGSEWRKWDLHVHTKADVNYKYSSDTNISSKEQNDDEYPKIFITHLYSIDNLGVIALTDHNSANWIDRIIQANENHNPGNGREKITILPGVEIETGDGIHLLVIFNPDSQLEDVKTNFRKASWKETIEHFLTSIRNIENSSANKTTEEILKEAEKWDAICIFAHVTNDKGFFRISSGDRKTKIYKHPLTQIFQIPNEGISNNGYLNIIEGKNPGYGNKSITKITASDAKSLKDIATNNCWIKADPTFEGLKQIIYEPEERVRIQENNPEYDFDKPTFSKINIIQPIEVFNGEIVKFDKTELPLNKNLVTIIGGRGTGKSLLLNYIANTFKKPILAYKNNDKDIQFNESEHFVIEWQKSNALQPEIITFNAKDKGVLDLIFIEQGKLKNIFDYKILANEIKKVLKIDNLQFDENLDKEIKELLDDIKKLKEWFEYKNEKGEKINDRQFNESKKQEAENLLKTITTEDNKKNLEIYTSNVKSVNNCENILSRLREIKNNLDKFQDDINNTISNINSDIQNEIKDISIPKIDFQSQTNAIKIIEEKITTIIKDKKEKNNEIKKEFEKQGYKGDLETLLSNAEKYQKNIQEAEVKLKEIEEREKQLNERLQQRNNLADKLKEEYERQKKEIDNAWNNLLNNFSNEQRKVISKILEKREISIEGEIYFNLKAFNEKLKEYLDLRTYKNLSEDIGINSKDDYWNFIKNTLKNFIEGKEKEKTKKELEDLFFNLQERKDYLYVIPKIKFLNKTLDQLSVGQRGTLYLLLQLATNTFSSPLIFDQPEDDLDNEFITTELVGLFKELKKYRQIIISTHNANLVVTADAEQVIVANNNNETLTYISGSLENSEIIRSVCRILEGGIDAFRKRERKYNIKIQ